MSRRRRRLTVAAAAVAVLAGCGDGSDDADDDVDVERLAGSYAHYDEVAYTGEAIDIRIVSYGLVELDARDGGLWADQEFCHAEQLTDQPIEMTLSDAATRAIIPPEVELGVREVDDGRLRLDRPATPTPVGIELDDPATESLPEDPSTARLVDADGDGNPGVTVEIRGADGGFVGELYLARREIFAYELTETGTGELSGSVTDSSEQLLIDATDPTLMASGDWVQVDDPSQSPVRWVPIETPMDCDELTDRRREFFGTPPPVDW